jgi:uncharacterized membrane protein
LLWEFSSRYFLVRVLPIAQQKSGDNDWHMMGPNMMERWGMGGFGGFLMLIFWIIIIIGAVYLTKLLMQNTQNKGDSSDRGRSGNPQPSDILKERYAKVQ